MSPTAVEQRREAARRPRPGRVGMPTKAERADLEQLKRTMRAEAFPLIADVYLLDVVRFHARYVRGETPSGPRVTRAQFDRASDYLADRCGWARRAEHDVDGGNWLPIVIGRPGFEKPQVELSGVEVEVQVKPMTEQ